MREIKEYAVSDKDIIAIDRLIAKGGCITRDSVNFEVGIISKGFIPLAYGSGVTIADAVNEAFGAPINDDSGQETLVTSSQVEQAMNWLNLQRVEKVIRC